ncbi:S8 family peptidase [Deinococcus ruber]|uniref:S8 family peptidase n=1 Tax=Deinococcus ruber TaxID=1848197 RepID=UPI001E5A629E|nr:S8 family serine peptidase [Deinococcus ruber]
MTCLPLLTCSLLVACGGTSTPATASTTDATTPVITAPVTIYAVSGTVTLPASTTAAALDLRSSSPDWAAPHVAGQVLVTGSTGSLDNQSVGTTGLRLANTPEGTSDQAYASALVAEGYQVQPNYLYRALTLPDDPGYPGNRGITVGGSVSTQTYLDRTDAASGWATLQTAGLPLSGAKVAILDTGADLQHPDLPGRLLAGYDFGDGDSDVSEDAGADAGHGTGVSGLIGAVGNNALGIAGLTWTGQTLLPVKVFSGDGASTAALASGIGYAVKQGARVINMSLGLPGGNTDTALAAAIQAAADADVLMVAAAGNTATDGLYYPASDPNVVAVGALADTDALACYSARPKGSDKALDLVAPGGNAGTGTSTCLNFTGTQILTLTTVANGTYALEAGTSEAAPLVSGAAALLRAERPDLSAAQIKAVLVGSARPVAGGRLLDLGAAVTLARTYAAPAVRSYSLTVQAQQSGQTVQSFKSSGTLTAGQSSLTFNLTALPASLYTLTASLTVDGVASAGTSSLNVTKDVTDVKLQVQ